MGSMHSHAGHLPAGSDRRALVVSGWLTGGYFVVELALGIWTSSVAVLSDAFHTFSAVGGVLVALVAARLSQRPATTRQTFGMVRAEIVGALLNGLFLIGMAGVVLWMGAMRLRHPIHLPTGVMLLAAAGGVATELVSLSLMYRHQKNDLNMRGAYWHILQTFVGSLIIVVSALVIRFTGFLLIDPILGMTFGLVLLWASYGIIRDSLQILVQSVPRDFDLERALASLRGLHGVDDVHHAHAWSLTSGKTIFSAHVCVPDPGEWPGVLARATELLRRDFDVYFSTLQLEQTCVDEGDLAGAIDVVRPGRPHHGHPEHRPS